MNRTFIEKISQEILGINTTFSDSMDYDVQGGKQDRLISIIEKSGAKTYISGPAAKNYINEGRFRHHNINIEWMDYSGYPDYPQIYGDFTHTVSILDLLFNVGEEAPWYIWGWREDAVKNEHR